MWVGVREVPDVVAGLFSFDQRRVLGLHAREDPAPVFDGFGRLSMDLEPDERLAKDAALRQRTLHSRMGGQVTKAALQHQRLTKPFDVAACERKFRARLSRYPSPEAAR